MAKDLRSMTSDKIGETTTLGTCRRDREIGAQPFEAVFPIIATLPSGDP
jgi:hypothetical protein